MRVVLPALSRPRNISVPLFFHKPTDVKSSYKLARLAAARMSANIQEIKTGGTVVLTTARLNYTQYTGNGMNIIGSIGSMQMNLYCL